MIFGFAAIKIRLEAYKELSVRELFEPQCVQPLESAGLASLSNNISFEDAALVRKIQEGDVDAFEHLVLKYQDRVYNICLRTVGHAEDARDLAQETFLKAFDAISRFEHKSSFYTWLFRIAVNLSISSRRRDRKIKMLSLSGGDGEPGLESRLADTDQAARLRGEVRDNEMLEPPEELKRRETQQAVAGALRQLDEDQRVILVLRDIESLDYKAIAEILDLPLGTVRSRLHRARLAMRDLLRPVMEKVG
ncbi:MAG: sigma-70 family RNA polymerase sigma factor [Planctomycetes bacterium]|nr:sigma-70 family RNA polymerase sigma factor [Planctomycetota bacterium]